LQWSFVKDFLSTGPAGLPVHCRKAKLQVSLSPPPQKKTKKIPLTSAAVAEVADMAVACNHSFFRHHAPSPSAAFWQVFMAILERGSSDRKLKRFLAIAGISSVASSIVIDSVPLNQVFHQQAGLPVH